jgi:hypothetical protein
VRWRARARAFTRRESKSNSRAYIQQPADDTPKSRWRAPIGPAVTRTEGICFYAEEPPTQTMVIPARFISFRSKRRQWPRSRPPGVGRLINAISSAQLLRVFAVKESNLDRFLREAEECLRQAGIAINDADKRAWVLLAEDWMKLVRAAQRLDTG